jgi:hypothetical protein
MLLCVYEKDTLLFYHMKAAREAVRGYNIFAIILCEGEEAA